MKKENRGRPIENDKPIEVYTQTFVDHTGEKIEWDWDKTKARGPLSVTIHSPLYKSLDKIEREIEVLDKKYTQKPGERKPRITKEDKSKYDQLQNDLIEEGYRFFPEDRPGFIKPPKEKIEKVTKPGSTGKRGRPKKNG